MNRVNLVLGLMAIALLVVTGGLWYYTSRPAPTSTMNADKYTLQLIQKGEKGSGYTPQEFQILKQYALYGSNRSLPPDHVENAFIRQRSIVALWFVRDENQKWEALQVLHSILNTTQDPILKDAAIQAIGMLGDPKDGDQIAPFLKHPDWKIREATVEALAHIGAPEHRQLIESLAQTEQVPQVREAIHKALQEWKQKTLPDRKTGGTK